LFEETLPSGPFETRERDRCCYEQPAEHPVHLPLAFRRGHKPELLAPNTPAAAEFRKLWESARKDLWAP